MDNNNEKGKKENKKWILFWVFGISALLILVAVGFYFNSANQVTQSEARINKVLDTPEDYYGENVNVTGNVAKTIGTQAFTLDAPQPFSGTLLVISKESLQPIGSTGLDQILSGDNRVRVQGEIRMFDLRKLEDELNTDLVDNQFVDWNGKPVMVADSVEINR